MGTVIVGKFALQGCVRGGRCDFEEDCAALRAAIDCGGCHGSRAAQSFCSAIGIQSRPLGVDFSLLAGLSLRYRLERQGRAVCTTH